MSAVPSLLEAAALLAALGLPMLLAWWLVKRESKPVPRERIRR